MKKGIKIRGLDNPMLKDLLLGNILFLVLGEVIFFLIFGLNKGVLLGYLTGAVFSMFMVIHMSVSIEESVRMDENSALKYIRKHYIIRVIAMIILFVIVWYTEAVNLASMMFGILILKLSAYIQPVTNRLTSKFLSKGR